MPSAPYPCKVLRLCFYVTLRSGVGTFRLGSTLGLRGKRFFSNEANSETAIDKTQQTDSATCKFVGFGSEIVTVMMQEGSCNTSAR